MENSPTQPEADFGVIEDTDLVKAVTYLSIILFAVILLEVLAIAVHQFKYIYTNQRRASGSTYSLRVNGSLCFAAFGILIILGIRVKLGFSLQLTKTDDVLLALGNGILILGYTLFMQQRSHALLGQAYIQKLIRAIIVVVFISIIGAVVCKYFDLNYGRYPIVNAFYGLMGTCTFAFDIIFTSILMKQIRQFNKILKIEDEELKYVAKVGLAMIGATVLVSIFYCAGIPFKNTSQINILMAHLTHQSEGLVIHIYIYSKFFRPTRRSRRLGSRPSNSKISHPQSKQVATETQSSLKPGTISENVSTSDFNNVI